MGFSFALANSEGLVEIVHLHSLARAFAACSLKYLRLCFTPWEIFHVFFLSSAYFFQNQLFQKILSRIPSECQTDWIQIRPDVLPDLFCIQTVFKGCQQMACQRHNLLSADNLCKQFGPRSGPTECRA